jgi:hypothetical protein
VAPYLNETARFVQNDAVSCKKKKEEQNGVVLSDTVPLPSSPGHVAGEEKKNICLILHASLSARFCHNP